MRITQGTFSYLPDFTDDEISAVRLESTRTIDIERFVDAAEIDRLYWDEPYFLLPDGKPAVEAYAVIREAMKQTGRIALGRLVMHTRERIVAIEPRERGLIATTLRSAGEVRDPAEAFDDIPAAKADRSMVEIAERIIAQQSGAFDPSKFADRYEEALKKLIAAKEKGGAGAVEAPAPEDTNVVDLMAALRRSLGQTDVRRTPGRRKPAANRGREPPARKRLS